MASLRNPLLSKITFAALCLITLSGCSGSTAVLRPESPGANSIANLFWLVFGVAAVIFVLVEGLLIFALIRFRNKPGAEEPKQVHGNARLEVAWTIVPALILVAIFVATVSTMVNVTQQQSDPVRVKVIAHQWWWEIQYPDLGITTAADLHVPVGQQVQIELVSADVIHSFWVPELAGKTDVIPGQTNWTRFTARNPGTYRGQCAEFCGDQHANMGFYVIAEPNDQFDDWVKDMREPAVVPSHNELEEGQKVFLGGACVGCHTINGTPARGRIGPNLTHFGSRKTIGALTVENNPADLAAWLTNPQSIKPGTKMPTPRLSQDALRELVDYLESLK